MRKWIYNVKNNISLHDGCGRSRLLSAASQAALVEHAADVVHNVSQAQYLTKFHSLQLEEASAYSVCNSQIREASSGSIGIYSATLDINIGMAAYNSVSGYCCSQLICGLSRVHEAYQRRVSHKYGCHAVHCWEQRTG